MARCRREHSTIAVMVCDLNGFKAMNDRYGHLAGDKVLKLFSSLMQEVCREYDYAARMGGDEFVSDRAQHDPRLGQRESHRC